MGHDFIIQNLQLYEYKVTRVSARDFKIYFSSYVHSRFVPFSTLCRHRLGKFCCCVLTLLLSSTSKLKTVHLQGFWSKTVYLQKTVHLQGFWPKTVYLKCFGNQLKTVYLQGPCSSRPCISRPCCTRKLLNDTICTVHYVHQHDFGYVVFIWYEQTKNLPS